MTNARARKRKRIPFVGVGYIPPFAAPPAPLKAKRKRKSMEQVFQVSLVKTLALVMEPEIFMFAVPNGGLRAKKEAAIFTSMGVVPGVPDLVFFHAGRALCLECKAPKAGLTDRQPQTIARIEKAGVTVVIVRTLREALGALRAAGFPLRMQDVIP